MTGFIRRENGACCSGRRNLEDRWGKYSLLGERLLKQGFRRLRPRPSWRGGQRGTSPRRLDGLGLCKGFVGDLGQEELVRAALPLLCVHREMGPGEWVGTRPGRHKPWPQGLSWGQGRQPFRGQDHGHGLKFKSCYFCGPGLAQVT